MCKKTNIFFFNLNDKHKDSTICVGTFFIHALSSIPVTKKAKKKNTLRLHIDHISKPHEKLTNKNLILKTKQISSMYDQWSRLIMQDQPSFISSIYGRNFVVVCLY